jgi:hypothetical protein
VLLQLASAYDPAEPDHGRSSARIALIRGRQPMPSIDNSMQAARRHRSQVRYARFRQAERRQWAEKRQFVLPITS